MTGKQYEIELFTGKKEQSIRLMTDKRKLAIAIKEIANENDMTCLVVRTVKRS
jgi:hypothetical protein